MAKPVEITNRQGKTQLVTPGKGYPYTKPDGTRGYIVYDDKGGGQFTAYPNQSLKPQPKTPEPKPQPPRPKPKPLTADQKSNAEYQKLRTTDPEAAKKLGMEIWAKKYSDASGKSKFTVPSVEKSGPRVDVATTRQREIISAVRGNKPIPPVTPVTKTKVDTAPAGTPPTGMTLSRQYQGNDTPGRLGQLETGYAGKPVKKKPQPGAGAPMGGPYTEAYDVVLDYLLSEGHAETVEEAHYVMMQLDSEYIQSIVEDSAPIPNIPSPVTKPKDTKKPPTDGGKDRPLVPPGGFGDLSKPRDRTPRGGIDMGRGTPPNHDPNKYKKGKPTPGRGEVAPNLPTF